ncbi:MiaB/RimO family radical SAM methylthiotransferase [Enorma phocaeensis]|uniref:MiaB/RimO family radical SAM methylthiotransferase n=1 Tax=Enorma phocaeensis TaxID=1871019 RepID=UPI000C859D87|nr:MiaB/RimO family radical SAM methylthiotransferase [Enorma phocaeensis]
MANPFVSVINLGCRVNRVESDHIERELEREGFRLVEPDEAELIIVNTCAVTGEAESKTRKAVRHALNRARSPWVIATGCAANLHPDALRELSERVRVESSKVNIVSRAAELLGLTFDGKDAGVGSARFRQARVGVKIQDGCNNRCTYCIVWKARGPERSVPVDAVLDQVRAVERAGLPEVVLTGVNLGAYDGAGPGDEHVEIDELLGIILRETRIPQIRLSSIEPMDVSERLIEAMAASEGRVAPYLHLPLQSGCTRTLERMGRPYTGESFEDLCRTIRERVPNVSLSCDLIVGFPGESDADFEESLALCDRVGFSRMHVFRYSPRPGTIACDMPDQVDPRVKEQRSRQARELAVELGRRDALFRIGSVERVVIERGTRGTTASFHAIDVKGAHGLAPALVDVAIMGIEEGGSLIGELNEGGALGAVKGA